VRAIAGFVVVTNQSSSMDLERAEITLTESGRELPVSVMALERGRGGRSALRVVPIGWSTEASRSYAVRVHGDEIDFEYVVDAVDCN
jgi:hypothetical protein